MMANLRALLFLRARKPARFAFFEQELTLSFCFLVVLAAPDDVSTPMSTPCLYMCMGMLAARAFLVKISAA